MKKPSDEEIKKLAKRWKANYRGRSGEIDKLAE